MNNEQSHIAFFMARVRVMYLVLVNKSAIMCYFLEHQLTGSLLSIKMKLEVDFWLFLLLV